MATTYHNSHQWISTSGLFITIMNGQSVLDPALQHELHRQISDLQPIDALTTIARSTRAITAIYRKASPAMAILEQECGTVLKRGVAAYEDIVMMMQGFQTLSELLKINISFLKAKDEVATDLLTILAAQADAHGMIIEEICRMQGIETVVEGRAYLPRSANTHGLHENPYPS